MRVVVTGGSGKGGAGSCATCASTATTSSTSTSAPTARPRPDDAVADLTDLGQTHDALAGADAVVHFAAIPAPGLRPAGETFRINALSTYNVFAAAVEATACDASSGRRARRSSGCRSTSPPAFAPIDETIEPRPESSYSLSKLVGETMADAVRPADRDRVRRPADLEHHGARRLRRLPVVLGRPALRKWNLWGYVDARDVATAARLGLEAAIEGAEVAIVAAADTVMTRPSADLMAEVFPDVPLRRRRRGPRDAPRDRPRPAAARLRAEPPLGRPRQRMTSVTSERGRLRSLSAAAASSASCRTISPAGRTSSIESDGLAGIHRHRLDIARRRRPGAPPIRSVGWAHRRSRCRRSRPHRAAPPAVGDQPPPTSRACCCGASGAGRRASRLEDRRVNGRRRVGGGHSLAIGRQRRCLGRHHESCPEPARGCAEHQDGRQASTVGDATGRHDRDRRDASTTAGTRAIVATSPRT